MWRVGAVHPSRRCGIASALALCVYSHIARGRCAQYNTLYLDQECCAAGMATASAGAKVKQCYYVDIDVQLPASLQVR